MLPFIRLLRISLNRLELLNLSPFGHPHSDQCLQAYRLAGGASTLLCWMPQNQLSDLVLGHSIGPIARLPRCPAAASAGRTSALCFSFPSPKPIENVFFCPSFCSPAPAPPGPSPRSIWHLPLVPQPRVPAELPLFAFLFLRLNRLKVRFFTARVARRHRHRQNQPPRSYSDQSRRKRL